MGILGFRVTGTEIQENGSLGCAVVEDLAFRNFGATV